MKDRWLPVGVLASVLFAINVVARLIIRFGFDGDDEMSDRVSLLMFVVIGVILAAVAFVVGRRQPVARWGADVAAAVLAALVLTIFVGPFVSGNEPFSNGAGEFFVQIWLYAGFAGGGTLLGFLLVTALGLDYRSQSLKRFAEIRQAKPRRVVRR
jgi:formate hydrogenlyase subunit 3/multisubunit Na+/H+ antiporter MnhD subunit